MGHSLLSAAVGRGDVGVVRALALSGKVDANKADHQHRVPLVEAAGGGNTLCLAALLVAPGIDVNGVDDFDGATPPHRSG